MPLFRQRSPPQFIEMLAGITRLRLNQKAELSVRVGGHPKPNVYWFKNNVQLRNCRGTRILSDKQGRHALVFDEVSFHEQGEYRILATNSHGERIECTTTIKVIQVYVFLYISLGSPYFENIT